MVEVFLSKGLICALGQCFAALTGGFTHPGTYQLQHVILEYDGKREPVLMYARDEDGNVYAIHGPPNARRRALLAAGSTAPVTAGCVNVEDHVRDMLIDCCNGSKLVIHP